MPKQIFNAVIIEDDSLNRLFIEKIVTQTFENINFIAHSSTLKQAKQILEYKDVDIAFMDVSLPDGNIFDLLEEIEIIDFKIIFLTAYEDFMSKAFKFNAIDYLIKPIDKQKLVTAIQRFINKSEGKEQDQVINNEKNCKKLVLNTQHSIYMLSLQDLIYCQSDNSYVVFHTIDGQKIVVSNSLSYYENLLKKHCFMRVNQSYIVNLDHISEFNKSSGDCLIMTNNIRVPVSQRRRADLIRRLKTVGLT